MSDSDAGDSGAELAALYGALVIENYCGFAILALVLCEHFVTFPEEVQLFWKRKWTGASVLFLANRYVYLSSIILGDVNL
ncbi:hypothetical protein C8Q76DRAFT_790867 [Earliella scabrosa]|nr:hypothetical protein C8Q76DRAFT_790867 [Earliella scabrosa]